ncbi:MAG TPA: hypothetical protein VJU18_16180 [Vicinamibacteria bacterium]|nr:hypothetical protein [Vicinamibacteria bacterium]
MRARHALHSMTRERAERIEEALAMYRRAIDLDPRFGEPWAGIAYLHVLQASFGHATAAEVIPQARVAAQRALAVDEGVGMAHSALGLIALYFDRDFKVAGETLERAVALCPTDSLVRHGYLAFQWLDQSYTRRDPFLLHVVADPRFDPIRSDPRFESLLKKIGVPRGNAH